MYQSRLARVDDAPQIANLQILSWSHRGLVTPESLPISEVTEAWSLTISGLQSQGRVLVVELNTELVGFSAVTRPSDGDHAELVALEVDPLHRRLGVGSRLMNASADIARRMNAGSIRAWIDEDENEAQELLRATGWDTTGSTRTVEDAENRARSEEEWVTVL